MQIILEACRLEEGFEEYVKHLIVFASICRHWRQACLSSPFLWSKINASDVPYFPWKAVNLCLQRSAASKTRIDMTVVFESSRENDLRGLIQMVECHQALFRRINVTWDHLRCEHKQLIFSLPQILSVTSNVIGLHSLQLDLSHSPEVEELNLPLPIHLHIGNMRFERLSSLSLTGNGLRVGGENKTAPFFSTCMKALQAAPYLQTLKISHYWENLSKSDNSLPSARLQLPVLRYLSLTQLRADVISHFLQSLQCPLLAKANIAPHREALNFLPGCSLSAFLSEANLSLKTLRTENVNLDEVCQSLIQCPSLHSLDLEGRMWDRLQQVIAILSKSTSRPHDTCPEVKHLIFTGFDVVGKGVGNLLEARSTPYRGLKEEEPFTAIFRRCSVSRELEKLTQHRVGLNLNLNDCRLI